LFLLSLALEDALARENWSEAQSLFDERAEEIAQISEMTPDRLQQIQEIEQRIFFRLRLRRSEVLEKISRSSKVMKAVKAYARRP
jgi:hypothetical protein